MVAHLGAAQACPSSSVACSSLVAMRLLPAFVTDPVRPPACCSRTGVRVCQLAGLAKQVTPAGTGAARIPRNEGE
jgi:hypothetical protein